MSSLHAYQAAFNAHLRDPSQPAPRGVDRKRMAVYREIVFNNFLASVRTCFPVLHSILGKRKFKQLVRLCFHSQHFDSPLFREIPLSFLSWLQTQALPPLGLPPFTAQLAHYEWIELYLTNLPVVAMPAPTPPDLLLQQPLQLNPAHVLLVYDYPVQQLSKRYQPVTPAATFLCVLRESAGAIRFIQLNAVSWQLLHIMAQKTVSGEQALTLLATELQHPQPDSLLQFGNTLLQQLHAQQVLI